jgi:phage terminase small subunit
MRGRSRKPTLLHLVEGTYREDRHGDRSTFDAMWPGEPEPPPGLSPDQLAIWSTIAAEAPAGVLRSADTATLGQYVILTDTSRKLAMAWDQSGCDPTSPIIRTMARLSQHLLLVETQLGFTPASRKRVRR